MSNLRKRVSYFYDEEFGNYVYNPMHPMKPHRVRMAHSLILNYGLYKHVEIFRPHLIREDEMTLFHADDYINFLQHVNPGNAEYYPKELLRYNMDVDCPVFDGLYNFCQLYTGGSIGGAYKLNRGSSDLAINWAGGLHHAKKAAASGFCYVNDIVLAILELLKYHARVLYIDIDIHHGDGVEEAFYTTDRVMTVSFHKFGDYFPGTGHINDIGLNKGKNYSVNFPLHDGIDDTSFQHIFKTTMASVMERYQPGAVVLQCGADSLSGDRLGTFNLSLKGHGACIDFMQSFRVPMLVLGGGGYTVRNVARCWAYETGLLVGASLADSIPINEYYEYYGPDFNLHITPSNMENQNSRRYLEDQQNKLLQMLMELPVVPSVQYSNQIPHEPDLKDAQQMELDMKDPDIRMHTRTDRRQDENEFYDDIRDQDPSKIKEEKTSGSSSLSFSFPATTSTSSSSSSSSSASSSSASSSSSSSASSSSTPTAMEI